MKIQTEGSTFLPPPTQLRKAAFGGSLKQLLGRIFCPKIVWLFVMLVYLHGGNAFAFIIGDRVQAKSGGIWIRSTAGGTHIGDQAAGSQGTVIGGPTYLQIGGTGTYYYWYNINFDSGTDGWAGDSGLTLMSAGQVTLTLYIHNGSASGPLISGAQVTVYDAAGNYFSQATGAAGYVTITGTPGTWQFTASASGYTANSWNQSITTTTTLNAYVTPTATSQVAAPTFSPAPATYSSAQSVTILTTTSGAAIRYTVNGVDPTSSSTLYSGPVTISSTALLKARAFKSGMTDSTVTSGTYTITTTTAVPPIPTLASPVDGGSAAGTTVTLAWNNAVGATKYVSQISRDAAFSSPITGNEYSSLTVTWSPMPNDGSVWYWRVKAGNTTGWSSYSSPWSFVNGSVSSVAAPTFSPAAGTYSSAQSVTVLTTTSGATIRYTLTGIDPTSSSTLYSGPVTVSSTTLLKARAFKSGMTDSGVTSGTYTINIPSGPANNNFASRTAISSSGGTVSGSNVNATKEGGEPYHAGYAGGKSVWWSWTPSVSGSAVIKTLGSSFDTLLAIYTGSSVSALTLVLNGSNDDFGGNTSQVTINVTAGTTYQIAVDGYLAASGNITLTVTPPVVVSQVVPPTFSPAPATYSSAQNVTISSTTSGATIRYTLTGIDPTSSSTLYSGPVAISSTKTLKARAFKSGMTDSTVTSGTYTINIPSGPANNNFASRTAISSSGGTVTGSNVNATKESGEPNHAGYPGGKSVWWSWAPSVSGNATISTVGSSFDTLLGIYTGTAVGSLTQRAADDDGGGNGTSLKTFSVTAGTTYQIAVDGFGGASGSITLTVRPPQGITAAIDRGLLDLIDQYAPTYYRSTWKMNIDQFKAFIATIANGEGGNGGYTAHSQGAPRRDLFEHSDTSATDPTTGHRFSFSTGIGPFQLDNGGFDSWELWPTHKKLDPAQAVQTVMKQWYTRFSAASGATLQTFANTSPWYAVRPGYGDVAALWLEVTGTSWGQYSGAKVTLDWNTIKNTLAANAGNANLYSYGQNVQYLGSRTWNIGASAALHTDSGKNIVFTGLYDTWLITARAWNGTALFNYYYTYDTSSRVEVWVLDNTATTRNTLCYVFTRDYAKAGNPPIAQFPEHRTNPGNTLASAALNAGAKFTTASPGPDSTASTASVADLNGTTQAAIMVDTVAIPPPVLATPTLIGQTFNISVTTVLGTSYTLEFKNSLVDTNWTAARTLPGTGGTITLTDDSATNGMRLYRVMAR